MKPRHQIRRRWKRDGTENMIPWEYGLESIKRLTKLPVHNIEVNLLAGLQIESPLAVFELADSGAKEILKALKKIFKE